MSLAIFFTPYFRKQESKRLDRIKKNMFTETNLYREMLGLSQLKRDTILDQTASNICDCLIKQRATNHDCVDDPFMGYYTENVYSMRNFQENLYVTENVNQKNAGLNVIQEWQLCDLDNKILTCPQFDSIGLGAKIGDFPSCLDSPGSRLRNGNVRKGLYLTQYYMLSDHAAIVLDKIEITGRIIAHLKRYVKYFSLTLNNFVNHDTLFRKWVDPIKIKNSKWLNKMAKKQIKSFIFNNISDEKTQMPYKSLIGMKNKKLTIVYTKTIHFPSYIPACRLINELENWCNKIKKVFKNKSVNKFGINVKLFENKTFLVSLIFAKSN
ncbi:hypothetical protein CDIK_1891 [Cucumispora dikerogammari]|nr:hypothetical protein CDIK_1891 [Cucumispora dikerogammari]